MRLPLTSWKNTLAALGMKVVKRQEPSRPKNRISSDLSLESLEARQMLAVAAVGNEFLVNTYTTGDQKAWVESGRNVAATPNGQFVASWTSDGQDGSGFGVYGQRFDAANAKQGSEFRANTTTSNAQKRSSVSVDASGNFVTVWESSGQDGDATGIFAQRYNAAGTAQGSEFQVNVTTTSAQELPEVAHLSNGGFVVTWSGKGSGDVSGVFARRYDSSGTDQTGEVLVNTYTDNQQTNPSIAAYAAGGFIIAWEGDGAQDGSTAGVFAQRFDSSGSKTGSEFQVNTTTTSGQQSPSVATAADGRVVIVWQSNLQDSDAWGIYGQLYSANGQASGSEFQVNNYSTGNQQYPSAAFGPNGGFVVAWNGKGAEDTAGIYAREFDASGNAVAGQFLVNTTTSNTQVAPTVTGTANGYVISWSGDGTADTHGDGVYARRYEISNTTPTSSGIAGVTVNEDANATVIDLFGAFADGQDTDAQLTYTVAANTNPALFGSTVVNATAGTLTLNYAANANGQADVTVRATDTGGLYVETAFHVTVNAVNDVPTSSGIANVTVNEDSAQVTRDLHAAFADVEDSDSQLTYTVTANSNAQLFTAVTIVAASGLLVMDFAPNKNGQAHLTVRGTDSGGLYTETGFDVTVNPVNDQPTTVGIADVTVDEDAQPTVIDLFSAFADIEDTPQQLTYSAYGYSTGGIFISTILSQPNGTLTLNYTPNASGQAGLVVRATDTGGLYRETTFHVTVNPVNDAPTSNGNMTVTVDEDAQPTVVTLFSAFNDIEDTPQQLAYSIVGNTNTGLFNSTPVSQQDGTLTLNYATNANGQADVTVRATDTGGLHVDATIHVTVNAINDVPTTSGIADVTVNEDAQPTVINLLGAFSDVEDTQQQLTYTVVGNSNSGLISSTSVDAQARTLTLAYAANANGQAAVTVRATDTNGSHVDTTFHVTVNSINDTPTTSGIANVVVDEDAQPTLINLLNLFSDVEDSPQQLTYSVIGNSNSDLFTSTTVENQAGSLTLVFAANANGQSDVTVRATDAGGLHVDSMFHVTVNAVNDTPTTVGIADVTVDEDAQPTVIHLQDVFSDVEDTPQQLTYSVVGNTNQGIFASTAIDDQTGILTLAYAANANGEADVTVRATDSGGSHVDTMLRVTVNPINDTPTTSGIADVTVDEDAQPSVINLLAAFSDVEDAQQLTFSVVANTNAGLFSSTTVDAQAGTLTLAYTPNANGESDLTVRATDAGGLHVDTAFHVTVRAINDAPSISGIANVIVDEDAQPTVIHLFDTTSDVEDSPQQLAYSVIGNTNTQLFSSIQVDGQAGTLTLAYASNVNGEADITVRATDAGGLHADTIFHVTVNPVNDGPTASGLASVTVDEDAQPTVVSLLGAFSDVENTSQQLTYSVVANSNSGLFSSTPVSQQNGTLTLNYAANTNGQADFTVRATDTGGLHVDTVLHVTVNPVNDAPSTSGIANVTVDEDAAPTAINLFDAFSDLEDTPQQLTYSIAGVVNSGLLTSHQIDQQTGALTLVYAANANGQTQITVRATDTDGLYVDTSFSVTVNAFNDAPTTSGIAAVTVDEDAQPTEINLFSAFADVENSPQQLTYSIVGNTNGPLFSSTPISQQNGTLTLNYAANSNGQADVTVRATDAGGLHVDTVLHVTVNAVNDQPTTSGLGDVAVMQDASPTVISLLGAFADVEDTSQQLTYTVVGNTNSALFSSTPVSQQNGTLTLNYATGANGQADITVRATDSGGLQVEANLHVTIKPVLYWDPDNNAANNVIGSGAGLGGSGTWSSGSGNNWFNPFTGQDVAWIDGARAVFSTAGGTVTISGTVSADKITVNGGSLTIQSGTLSLPTTSGTSIEVVAGTTTINSTLAGPGGLTKSGAGTLTLSGTNTFTSGVTILNAGVLQLGSAGALNATTPNRVTFGAASTGTLRLAGNSVVLSGLSTVDATSTAGVENASGTLATITVNKTTGTSDTFAGILRNGTGAQVLALTKTGAGTLALSGANTFTGLTTAGGGTLQFSGPTTAPAVSSILVNGGDISIDNGVTLTSRTGNIQFSSNNTIKPTGGSGAMGFAAVNSVYTVTVDAGVTATISAGITGTTTGNVIKRLGSGTLILNGQNNLVADANANLTAFVAVDGGGQLNVTGGVKAASALQSNRTNGISTVGQASSGNALNITGTGQLVAGRLDVGVSTFGNNTVTIASPGTAANPSYSMLGSGAQLNLGVSSSGNSLIVSNGAYLSQSAAGGTNTWTIGTNAGANNNSLLIAGAGSTVNRTAAAGSAIAVGALGNSNSLTVSAGGLLLPRRLTVGTGTAAGNGSNNSVLVTGAGSSISIPNDSNGVFQVGSGVGSSGNSLSVTNGGSVSLVGASAARDFSIGSANGANNNFVQIVGAGSSAVITNQGAPLAIGGINHTGSIVNSTATGNHLDVYAGASATLNSVYLMGVDSAFNLGDGTGTSTAIVGNPAFNAASALINLSVASARLNINGGRLTAGASNTLIGGPGSVQLNGAAFIATAGFNDSISSTIAGSGGLTKEGAGTLTLSGTDTYSGPTVVNGGKLAVTGALTNSAVSVNNGATLAGSGTISAGASIAAGGALSPGDTATAVLNTGNLSLAAGSQYMAQLNGDAVGTEYDQANVTGTVALAGAQLVLSGTRVVHDGTTIVIVKNDGTDAVSGTFNNLAEGAAVDANGVVYHITYHYNAETGLPDTGNDIALIDNITLSGLALDLSSPTIDENGGITLSGTFNNPGATGGHTVSINWGDGSAATTVSLPAGTFQFGDVAHQYLDNRPADAPYTIHVTVTDESNAVMSADIELGVTNVAPTATIANSGPVNQHNPVTVSVSGSDVSTVDAANLHYVISTSQATRDAATYATAGTITSQSYTFTHSGTYTVYSRVLDKDGGYTDQQTDVTVDPPLTLYWDANGAAPGLGGSGTWDNSTANWTTSAAGDIATRTWLADSDAVFQGTAGTVTVSGSPTIDAIRFSTMAYVVQSGNLILFDDGQGITVDSGVSATIGSVLPGSASLTKLGGGTLVLAGTNIFSGGTTISAGTLALSGGTALPDAGAVSLAADATLSLQSDETIGSLSGAGNVDLTSHVLTVGANNTSTLYAGVIGGSGQLAKIGSGTLALTGDNTYTGGTLVTAGTLSFDSLSDTPGAPSALGNSGTITVYNATFQYTGTDAVSTARYNGGGIGAGVAGTTVIDVTQTAGNLILVGGYDNYGQALSKIGAGELTLSGVNVYGWGSVGVHAGTLILASKETSPDGYTSITDINSVDTGATLQFAPYTDGVYYYQMNQNADFNFTMTGGTLDLNGDTLGGQEISAPSGTGIITNSSTSPALLRVGVFAAHTFSGTIQDGAGTVAVLVHSLPNNPRSQAGSAWTLTGHNTYSGGTTIAGGAVLERGAADALPINGAFRLGDETLGAGILDLGGFDLTLPGLYTAAATDSHSHFWDAVVNSSATPVTLTIDNSADYFYGGHFAGNLSIDKFGAGLWTVDGVSTNTGPVHVYDGTINVTGAFVSDVSAVAGSGDPHLLGKVDPVYFVVTSTAIHGEAAFTLDNYQFLDYPATGLQTTSAIVLATDWRTAVYQAVQGRIKIKPTGQTLSFPTISATGSAPPIDVNYAGNNGFLVGTALDLKKAVNAATHDGNFSLLDKNSGTGEYVYKAGGITSEFTRLITMEDLTNNPKGFNDKDYDDAFWTVNVVTLTSTDAYARETPASATFEPKDIGEFTVSRGEGNNAGALKVYYRIDTDLGDGIVAATDGTDYQEINTTVDATKGAYVTIPDGYSSATIKILPLDNSTVNWDRVVHLTVTGVEGDVVVQPSGLGSQSDGPNAQVTILDDDEVSGLVNRNADMVSTGEGKQTVGNGTVNVDVQGGEVTLSGALKFDQFSPVYHGNDNLQPIISVETQFPSLPPSFDATLNIAGHDAATVHFDASQVQSGDTLRFVLLGPSGLQDLLATGHYDWDIKFVANFPDSPNTRTIRGSTELLNRVKDSFGETFFGKHWWIDGLDEIAPGDGNSARLVDQGLAPRPGMALVRGDGSTAWYATTISATTDDTQIIDDSDTSHFTTTGTWVAGDHSDHSDTVANGPPISKAGYNAGYQVSFGTDSSSGSTGSSGSSSSTTDVSATWTFTGKRGGRLYQVFAAWVPNEDAPSSDNVSYTITGANPLLGTAGSSGTKINIDQTMTPGDVVFNGTHWRSLGYYYVSDDYSTTADLVVTLDAKLAANQNVNADAVMVVDNWSFLAPDGSTTSNLPGSYFADQLKYNKNSDGPDTFTLKDKFGTQSTFDFRGHLIQQLDRNQNRTEFTWGAADSNGIRKLTNIQIQNGLTWTFEYSGNYLTDVKDFNNRIISYGGDGNVTSVTFPSPGSDNSVQPATYFAYGGGGSLDLLTRVTRFVGHSLSDEITRIAYDSQTNRVASVTNPDGLSNTWKITPFLADGLQSDTESTPLIRKPATSAKIGKNMSQDDDPQDNQSPAATFIEARATYTDPNGVAASTPYSWVYQVDEYGRVIAKAAPAPAPTGVRATDRPKEDVWVWERDWGVVSGDQVTDGLTVISIQPTGGALINDDNSDASTSAPMTIYSYLKGNLTNVVYPDTATESWEYGVNNQLTYHQDQVSRTTNFALDSYGNVTTITESGPDGLSRTTSYDAPGGGSGYTPAPSSISDLPGGLPHWETVASNDSTQATTTNTVYWGEESGESGTKKAGLVKRVTVAFGTPIAAHMDFDYDDNRNRSKSYDLTESDVPGAGALTSYVSDNLDQLVSKTLPINSPAGNPVTESYSYYGTGTQASYTDGRGNTWNYQYDGMNRLAHEIAPLPGGITVDTEQANATIDYLYDPNGNLQYVYSPGISSSATKQETKYTYDARNQKTKAEMPVPTLDVTLDGSTGEAIIAAATQRPTIVYTYDTLGNLTSQSDPRNISIGDGTFVRTTFWYDSMGRNRRTLQANGNTFNWTTYYADGALKTTSQPAAFWPPIAPNLAGPDYNVYTTDVYDGLGRLSYEVKPANDQGEQLLTHYVYDLRDNIVRTELLSGADLASGASLGIVATNVYDRQNRLIAAVSPTPDATHPALVSLFAYDDAGHITRELSFGGTLQPSYMISDGQGAYYLNEEQIDEVLAGPAAGAHRFTKYVVDNIGRVTGILPDATSSNPGASWTEQIFDGNGNVVRVVQHFRDTDDSWKTLTTDTQYDALNRTYWVYGPATNPDAAAGEQIRPETQTAYNLDGSIKYVRTKNVLAGSTTADWRQTQFFYDGASRRYKTVTPSSSSSDPSKVLRTYVFYDASGNTIATIDSAGIPTVYGYNNLNQNTSIKKLLSNPQGSSGALAAGGVTTTKQYYANGTLRRQFDTSVDGSTTANSTEYTYDSLGHVVEVNQNGSITTTVYNVLGQATQITDPVHNVTKYEYDKLGRARFDKILIEANGTTPATWVARERRYDPFGDLTQTIDRDSRVIQYEYDNRGRKTSEKWFYSSYGATVPEHMTAADGANAVYSATFSYTGLNELSTASDELIPRQLDVDHDNNVIYGDTLQANSGYTYHYDALRRADSVTQNFGLLPDMPIQFGYQYDLLGNHTQTTTKINNVLDSTTNYVFDRLNRIQQIQQFGATVTPQTVGYYYTSHGQLDSIYRFQRLDIDPNATPNITQAVAETDASYYSDGRLSSFNHFYMNSAAASATADTNFLSYDSFGRIYTVGRMNGGENEGPLAYDANSQVTSDGVKSYSYDANGNQTLDTAPYNRIQQDGYNKFLFYDNEGNVATRVGYEDLFTGGPSRGGASKSSYTSENDVSFGNGTYRLVFDPLKFDTAIPLLVTIEFGDTTISDWDHKAVDTVQLAPTVGGTTKPTYFDFDYTGGPASGKITITFNYREFGLNWANNLTSGGFAIQYPSTKQQYTYDFHNRIDSVTVSKYDSTFGTFNYDHTDFYRYDLLGNRIGEITKSSIYGVENKVVPSVWDNGQRVLEFGQVDAAHPDSQVLARRSLYAQAVDQILSTGTINYVDGAASAGTLAWALTDHQGTVRDVISHDGTTVNLQHLRYTTFGKPLGSAEGAAATIRQRYTGREYDADTGLAYYRARFMEPSGGRFMSEDPALSDINPYRYAGNSPTQHTDPSGQCWGWLFAAGGAVIGAASYTAYTWATDGTFTWQNLGSAAAMGATAGFVAGALTGDETSLAGLGLMAAGAGVGATNGGLQAVAANPNASTSDIVAGAATGGLFGAMNPYGAFGSAGGAVIGGGIDAYYGGRFLGRGFQVGGLIGGLAGGFYNPKTGLDTAMGMQSLLWQGSGMALGGAIGYGTTGSFEGTLAGMNFGMMAGGIAQGAWTLLNSCFVAGTPILTPDGETPIEQLKPGDLVLSRDEANVDGRVDAKVVEMVFILQHRILELSVGGQTVHSTLEHPFYVKLRGWTAASELQSGDLLATLDGRWLPLESVRDTGRSETVYNLRVADYHTYFIGGSAWDFALWVHNKCAPQSNFYNKLLREKVGPPPEGMFDPHAHHILYKNGLGEAQQALVAEGQEILRSVGIDPVNGIENLVWAPNRVVGQHGPDALKNVLTKLRQVQAAQGGYDDFVEALELLGRIAAKRT